VAAAAGWLLSRALSPASGSAPAAAAPAAAAPVDEHAAKAESGGTLVTHPASYGYLLQHVGEASGERALRQAVQAAPRARMMGSPDEACFLRWLLQALSAGVRRPLRAVEVGVFRGTTTLHLARGVGAGGEVVALDVSGAWLEAGGRAAWAAAGMADRIRFVEGPAVASMQRLLAGGGAGTFDLVFIDADKTSYPEYYESALLLLRVGGIVAVDNVLWGGRAEHPPPGDEESQIIHDLNELIRADPRVDACMLGIADGVYFARKL
jgi:predicted O-methyltransferase YrrM